MNSDERHQNPADPSEEGGARSREPSAHARTYGEPYEGGQDVDDELSAERREVGDADGSSKHPPHVARHELGAPIQEESESPTAVPVLPANAGGRDSATADEQDEPVDPESMYDRRPERFEDSPPSERSDPGKR